MASTIKGTFFSGESKKIVGELNDIDINGNKTPIDIMDKEIILSIIDERILIEQKKIYEKLSISDSQLVKYDVNKFSFNLTPEITRTMTGSYLVQCTIKYMGEILIDRTTTQSFVVSNAIIK